MTPAQRCVLGKVREVAVGNASRRRLVGMIWGGQGVMMREEGRVKQSIIEIVQSEMGERWII